MPNKFLSLFPYLATYEWMRRGRLWRVVVVNQETNSVLWRSAWCATRAEARQLLHAKLGKRDKWRTE